MIDQSTIRRRGVGLRAYDPQKAGRDGVTLFAPQSGNAAFLIDMEGRVLHEWKLPYRPGRHVVLLPNGNLGYAGNRPEGAAFYPAWTLWRGGLFQELTPAGDIVWSHKDAHHHHDVQWLADGSILYGALEPLEPAFAERLTGGLPHPGFPEGVYGDVIRQVDRGGKLIWSWRAADHLDPEKFLLHPNFDTRHWPLINGLAVTKSGLVLASLRTTSGIIGIDRESGEIRLHIPYPVVTQQHAPVELENGNILAFDNGNLRPGIATTFSQAVEIDPQTGKIVWRYADPVLPAFFSPYMGSVQRLGNGNTHITDSATGRLFDVTPDGELVWEYIIPQFATYPDAETRAYVPGPQNTVFRSFRYDRKEIHWL